MKDQGRITEDPTPVEALKNLGPTTAGYLRAVGVHTRADLDRLGPVFAYLLLRHRFPDAGINALFLHALHGALTDEALFAIAPDVRRALTAEARDARLTWRPVR